MWASICLSHSRLSSSVEPAGGGKNLAMTPLECLVMSMYFSMGFMIVFI